MQASPRKDSRKAPQGQPAAPHGSRAGPAGRLELTREPGRGVSGGTRPSPNPARRSAEAGVEQSLTLAFALPPARNKRSIPFGRRLSRIMAVHCKRAATVAQLRMQLASPHVGNQRRTPQVGGSSRIGKGLITNWKSDGGSRRQMPGACQPQGALSHGKNVITRGPFHQHAQGHVLRRKADPEGLAEDDKAGRIGRTAARLRAPGDTNAAGKTCAAIKAFSTKGRQTSSRIQRRPDIDRACGGSLNRQAAALRLFRFFRLCERRRYDRAVFVSA